MSVNAVKDAIPSTGTQSYSALRTALAAGIILPLVNAAAVTAFNAEDNAAAFTPYPGVDYAGSTYYYDSSDTTSAHDPAGGVIVDGSGRRYIRAQGVQPTHIVLDKDLTAPPGGESFGDAYYVATSATGDWAGHDGEYAIYSDRGWLFADIEEGWILYVADEAVFYHMPASGTLTQGLGDLALADSSIEAKHLASPMGLVVQAAQTTPPGSPSDRVCYIVTATATGAWAGQENDVAEYDSDAAAWVFHTPRAGDIVWDIAAGYLKVFGGSAWGAAVTDSALQVVKNWLLSEADTDVTLPNAVGNRQAMLTVSVQTEAGKAIVFDISKLWLKASASGNGTIPTVGLYRDTESSPLWTKTSPSIDTSVVTRKLIDPDNTATSPSHTFTRIMVIAADSDPHDYHFDLTNTFYSVDTLKLYLEAEVSVRRAPDTTV